MEELPGLLCWFIDIVDRKEKKKEKLSVALDMSNMINNCQLLPGVSIGKHCR